MCQFLWETKARIPVHNWSRWNTTKVIFSVQSSSNVRYNRRGCAHWQPPSRMRWMSDPEIWRWDHRRCHRGRHGSEGGEDWILLKPSKWVVFRNLPRRINHNNWHWRILCRHCFCPRRHSYVTVPRFCPVFTGNYRANIKHKNWMYVQSIVLAY